MRFPFGQVRLGFFGADDFESVGGADTVGAFSDKVFGLTGGGDTAGDLDP